jgi:hypothetical protein
MVQRQLTLLKLERPQCVQCTTKKFYAYRSKIICGNNVISNVSYTEFLGLIIDSHYPGVLI